MNNEEKLVAIWPPKGKFANITWQVSDVCNYKCSYCNPGNYGANHKNLDTEKYIAVLDKMIGNFKAQGYKYFKFFFSGGEPTVWPPLLEICKFIRSATDNSSIAVNTNLSRPLNWWEKNHVYFDDVVASFHIEGCDKENYLRNINFLQYRLNYLACRILLHDSRFQEVVEFSEQLKSFLKNGIIEYAALFEELSPHSEMHFYEDQWKRDFIKENSYIFKREIDFTYLNNRNNKAYCHEYFEGGIERGLNATRVISSGQNNFKGWTCWINDSIFINPIGEIQLASCKMAKKIGNMSTGELNLDAEPTVCAVNSCGCGTDINIRKVHPNFKSKFISGIQINERNQEA